MKTQEIGCVVNEFNLRNVQGVEQSLSSFLKGKKGAVVMFWSGICSHCARYDEYLNNFESRHPDLALVAVASRHGEALEQIRKTIAERKLWFPILHDPDGAVAREWFTQQTPRAFLIDSDRTLLYRGAIDNFKFPTEPQYAAYLERAITEYLAGQPVLRTETAGFGCAIQSVYYILPKSL
jgi:peroxiredoxin